MSSDDHETPSRTATICTCGKPVHRVRTFGWVHDDLAVDDDHQATPGTPTAESLTRLARAAYEQGYRHGQENGSSTHETGEPDETS